MQQLALEWRAATPGSTDGTLALTLGGRLALWLDTVGDRGEAAKLILLGNQDNDE